MMEGVLVVDIVVFPRREPSKEKVDQQKGQRNRKIKHNRGELFQLSALMSPTK